MKTFNEWMQVRSSHQAISDWNYVTESDAEEAKKFLEEKGPELFRSFEVQEVAEVDGKTVVSVKGDPQVTIFELEQLGITPATC